MQFAEPAYAAAHVTHVAARMEAALRGTTFETAPSQNLVRALLVSSARPNNNVNKYVDKGDLLHTVGYGQAERRLLLVSTESG